MKTKLIALFLALGLTAGLLAGCAADTTGASASPAASPSAAPQVSASAAPAEGETRVITDMAGREVEIPAQIDTIATFGSVGVLNAFVELMGCGDKICNEMPPRRSPTALCLKTPTGSCSLRRSCRSSPICA